MSHVLDLTESSGSGTSAKAASLGDIGIIVTSKGATPAETATLDAQFPLNKQILITDVSGAAAKAGTGGGTMLPVLTAIAQITSPVIVLVRVEEGETDAETAANIIGVGGDAPTGLQALKVALAAVGRRPRIIGAPGLETAEITAAMVILAKSLRGRVYARALGDTIAEIVTYRGTYAARELTLIDNDTSATFSGEAVARAMALRALIDLDPGYHKTISNVAIDGVTALTKNRHFDLLDATTDAGVLNDADVVTIVRRESGGFVFWGNTTCAEAGSDYAFESAVWTLYALQDIIVTYFGPYFDKPMNVGMVKNLLEKVNKAATAEKTAGRLMLAAISLSTSGNTSAELAAGRPKFQIKFTPCAPMNNPSVDFAITDEGYDGFAEAVATSD
jgi:uncharacterized protein